MRDFFAKNWKMILFAIVVLVGVFLRVWHFHDWLFFKMDQARDALLIRHSLEGGPGWLPLLGPKAGGTHLNLGPAFYYFQYISAFIFQSAHPAVLAYPDLLFAILSIPLFFAFARKYFSRDWSLVLAGLYAVCFLGIQYSRFAWNPNSLVFFNLLFFYALLSVFDGKTKYKLRWVVMAGFSFAVSTQLHFLSFGTLPLVTLVFLTFNRKGARKHLNWKSILLFVIIIVAVYGPVFANELTTHGKNTAAFLEALKDKPSNHTLWQNINRNVRYWGQYWFLIATSWISKKGDHVSSAIAWLMLMLPGFVLAVKFYRGEKDENRKNFLLVSILWFLVYFLVYIPIAYQIRPRFFLPVLALPFVFVGYVAKFFWEKNGWILKAAVAACLAVVFLGNLAGTYLWFKEIKNAQKKGTYPQRTIILKARDGIVLQHLEEATRYIKGNCGQKVVFANTNAEYKSPVRYLLLLEGIETFPLNSSSSGKKGCFYAFALTRTKKDGLKEEERADFEIVSKNKFGALTVYELQPKTAGEGSPPEPTEEKSSRIFWKDILK